MYTHVYALGEPLAGLAEVAHQRPEHAAVPLHHLLLLVDLRVCGIFTCMWMWMRMHVRDNHDTAPHTNICTYIHARDRPPTTTTPNQ